MPGTIEIISKGRCVPVSEGELSDVRTIGCGWFAYEQQRLDKSHAATLQYFAQYPTYAARISALTVH